MGLMAVRPQRAAGGCALWAGPGALAVMMHGQCLLQIKHSSLMFHLCTVKGTSAGSLHRLHMTQKGMLHKLKLFIEAQAVHWRSNRSVSSRISPVSLVLQSAHRQARSRIA